MTAPSPRRILVVKPSSLGDIVHTLPAVSLVRERWPEAEIRWLTNPEWIPLLEGNSDINGTLLFPRRALRGRPLAQLAWLRELRAEYRADLVLDFQGLLRSAIIGRACLAPGGELIGLSDAREGAGLFYHRRATVSGGEHSVERYLKLVGALGLERGAALQWPMPQGNLPAGWPRESEPFLVLHPFARGKGKSLTVEDIEQFCRALEYPIVLVGRSDLNVTPLNRLENVFNYLNETTIPEMIALMREAAAVVSVDSGPMHIAAALGKPLLGIHTWSDPAQVGPYDPDAWVLKDQVLFQMRTLHSKTEKRQAAPDMNAVAAFVRESLFGPRSN